MPLPKLCRIRQTFDRPRIADVPGEVQKQLSRLQLQQRIKPGQTVAITVGSRGIANIAQITKAVVDHCKGLGLVPFIVPAMGSHGGATAEGQQQLLAGFNVTPEFLGAEVRSSMETVVVSNTPEGIPVHFDKHAFAADHVIVMGRIKPHTGFVGDIESGLHKMMLIGLGKRNGAIVYHRAIHKFSFDRIIRSVAAEVLAKCKVLCGVAIVENPYDETGLIEAVAPADFYEREKALLKQAIAWLPRLPFPEVDLLIVDRMGKEISGTGLDPNITGRKEVPSFEGGVTCERILVRGLTEKTKGNACGIGYVEFTTQRLMDQLDSDYTRINCITAGKPEAGRIPLVYPTDKSAIEDALLTIGMKQPENAGVVQIADTLHLEEVLISDVYLRDLKNPPFEILSPLADFQFDASGALRNV